jgi:putative transposase
MKFPKPILFVPIILFVIVEGFSQKGLELVLPASVVASSIDFSPDGKRIAIGSDDHLVKGKFSWQGGYGAFSYSRSQRDSVIKYILNQEEHHTTKTFREEYLELLKLFEVEFDEKYLFEFYD